MDPHARGAQSPEAVSERLRTALDLWTAGVDFQRQRLRREHPEASPAEISRLISMWLRDRPGARLGDGPQMDLLAEFATVMKRER